MTKQEMLTQVKNDKVAELKFKYEQVILAGNDFEYHKESDGSVVSVHLGSEVSLNGIQIALNASKARGDNTVKFSDSANVIHTLTDNETTELLGAMVVWGDAQWFTKKTKQVYVLSLTNADTDISKVLDVTWDSVES